MKYKVGDRVRIRKGLKVGNAYGSCLFKREMKDLCGKIARITEVHEHYGDYCVDSSHFYWTDEMFEDNDTEIQKMKHKVGDKVRIRRDLSEDIEFVNEKMLSYAGELATITRTYYHKKAYGVDIDEGDWVWHDSMFEDVDMEGQQMNKRVVIDVGGNKVVARCGDKEGIARCHTDDKFDFYTGAKLALKRLGEAEKTYAWLKVGVRYYFPAPAVSDLYNAGTYEADDWDKRAVERGLVFQTKEEAIECAHRMLAAVKREG